MINQNPIKKQKSSYLFQYQLFLSYTVAFLALESKPNQENLLSYIKQTFLINRLFL